MQITLAKPKKSSLPTLQSQPLPCYDGEKKPTVSLYESATTGKRLIEKGPDTFSLTSQIPLDYVVVQGQIVILNTRTSAALQRAGVPRSQWHGIDRTGQQVPGAPPGTTFDDLARGQTTRNNLPPTGTATPPE